MCVFISVFSGCVLLPIPTGRPAAQLTKQMIVQLAKSMKAAEASVCDLQMLAFISVQFQLGARGKFWVIVHL